MALWGLTVGRSALKWNQFSFQTGIQTQAPGKQSSGGTKTAETGSEPQRLSENTVLVFLTLRGASESETGPAAGEITGISLFLWVQSEARTHGKQLDLIQSETPRGCVDPSDPAGCCFWTLKQTRLCSEHFLSFIGLADPEELYCSVSTIRFYFSASFQWDFSHICFMRRPDSWGTGRWKKTWITLTG